VSRKPWGRVVELGVSGVLILNTHCDARHQSTDGRDGDPAMMQLQDNAASSTDEAALARLITLPHKPIAVQWKTSKPANGGNWSLTALIELSPADVADVLANTRRLKRQPRISQQFLAWFPKSVREKYKAVPPRSDGFILVDAVPISPERFLANDRSPLTQGTVDVFEAERLVYLNLFTM